MTVRIENAAPADLEDCVAIWARAIEARDGVDDPAVPGRARAKLTAPRRLAWLVARDGETPVAFALASEGGTGTVGPHDPAGYAYLGLLAVAPGAWGRGIATQLLDRLAVELAATGAPGAYLHVLTENTGAIRRYEGAGWHPFGEVFAHPATGRPSLTYVTEFASTDVGGAA
ncbi:GNAT family N-acetyltransferase [Gryllotalpicola koreensis]|uniref:N-acetyltransferase domain-containing protein n=1 Tax=Gryllotalpicola koreensis TaxID=993086 RepID=A0ABP8A808_9MICO